MIRLWLDKRTWEVRFSHLSRTAFVSCQYKALEYEREFPWAKFVEQDLIWN